MQEYKSGIEYATRLLSVKESTGHRQLAETFSDLSYCHYKCENYQEAQKRANDALRLDGDCVNALLNKGVVAQALGDSLTAKRCFDQVT